MLKTVSVDVEFLRKLHEFFQDMEPPRESMIDDYILSEIYDEFYESVFEKIK